MAGFSGQAGGAGSVSVRGRRRAARLASLRRAGWPAVQGAMFVTLGVMACGSDGASTGPWHKAINGGRQIFRFETFGDETFWTDTLRMHEVVQGVPPTVALALVTSRVGRPAP